MSRRFNICLAILVFAIVIGFTFSNTIIAWAFTQTISPWGKDVVTYYNDSDYDVTLDYAIKRWEETGVPVRFKEIYTDDADLTFRDDLAENIKSCNGQCTAYIDHRGFSFLDETSVIHLRKPWQYEDELIEREDLNIIIHEVGHFLGLKHSSIKECAVMYRAVSPCKEDLTQITDTGSIFTCGPFPEDIERLHSLYEFPRKDEHILKMCGDPRRTIRREAEIIKPTPVKDITYLVDTVSFAMFIDSTTSKLKKLKQNLLYVAPRRRVFRQIKSGTKRNKIHFPGTHGKKDRIFKIAERQLF